jgi:DNA-binding NarL/FixJ family response regulator
MGDKPQILFVDDEPSVLNGLRRSFLDKEATWDLAFLSSPEEAIAACRTRSFDVVVSDMKMPVMSGIELIVAIRRIMPEASYIMLTGAADLRGAIDSINRAGIFRFFTKPCPSFLLKEGIAAALFTRRPTSTVKPTNTIISSVGEEALNQLSVAVVVVNSSGRISFMNRRGGELCAEGDGLCIGTSDICRASTHAESNNLHDLIRESASAGTRRALSISRPSMKRPLFVVVAPLSSFMDGPNNEASVALYISDPEHNSVPPPEQLAALLDLPPAKAKLAHSLAQGESLEEAAIKLSITTETARTYLKDIFSRTGTSRQAELVKLVLSHPAVDIRL